jgi:hypothetical protein
MAFPSMDVNSGERSTNQIVVSSMLTVIVIYVDYKKNFTTSIFLPCPAFWGNFPDCLSLFTNNGTNIVTSYNNTKEKTK